MSLKEHGSNWTKEINLQAELASLRLDLWQYAHALAMIAGVKVMQEESVNEQPTPI